MPDADDTRLNQDERNEVKERSNPPAPILVALINHAQVRQDQ